MYNSGVLEERDDSASNNASRRADWPVRKYSLDQEPSDDLSESTTAEERLAMMWPLALEAWVLTGVPLPDYVRRDAPVRLQRSRAD